MSGSDGRVTARLRSRTAELGGGCRCRITTDTRAVVRSDERVFLFFLLLLSIVAVTVFLYYTIAVLDGLPEVPPTPSST